MNYEQKYKFAIEQAKKELDACGSMNCDAARQIFRLFPELKESEDERVRENAIQIIRYSMDGTDVALPLSIYKECIAWLEKQGEQRSDSKIEPKFKVGDFIVHNNIEGVCQVTEIKDDKYCIWPLYAEIKGYLSFIDVDNDYHLWTIQDAKNGDVLCYRNDIFLLDYYKLYSKVRCHCCYSERLMPYNIYSFTRADFSKIHPATREQCDVLFQKIKEAGYRWDSNRKELIWDEQQQ